MAFPLVETGLAKTILRSSNPADSHYYMAGKLSSQMSLKYLLVAKSQVEGANSAFYVVLPQEAKTDAAFPSAGWYSHTPWASGNPFSKEFMIGIDQTKQGWRSSFSEASFKLMWAQRNLHSKTLLLSSCCGQHGEYTQIPATTNLIIWQQEDTLSTGFFHLLWGYSILKTGIPSNVCSPGSIPLYRIGSEMQGVSGRRWESRAVESPKHKD